MREQIIQLERYDDVVSVRDRLAWIQAERVLLVFPPEGGVLMRQLDLVLVRREAARRGAKIALITTEPNITEIAQDLRIPVFGTISESHRKRWVRKRGSLFVRRRDKPVSGPSVADMEAAAKRMQTGFRARFERNPWKWRFFGLLTFGIVMVILMSAAYLIGPSATVILYPAANQEFVQVAVTADPLLSQVELRENAIPADNFERDVEWTTQISTTGVIDIPQDFATGTVTFLNRTREPVTVPVGTIVRTSTGQPIRFRTLEEVAVPGYIGGVASTEVEALPEFEGTAGNVDANLINRIEDRQLNDKLAVRNDERLRGGGLQQVPAVAQQDIDNLLANMRQELIDRALAEMYSMVAPEQFLVEDSLRIVSERPGEMRFSHEVGEPADILTLTMRARVRGVAFNERYAQQVAYAELSSRIGPGYKIITGPSLEFRRGDIVEVDDAQRVTFLMSCAGYVAADINVNSVREQIAGLSVTQVSALLSDSLPLRAPDGEQSSLVLSIWPGWWRQVPVLPVRISVQVRYPS
jgi:hypothetical protein